MFFPNLLTVVSRCWDQFGGQLYSCILTVRYRTLPYLLETTPPIKTLLSPKRSPQRQRAWIFLWDLNVTLPIYITSFPSTRAKYATSRVTFNTLKCKELWKGFICHVCLYRPDEWCNKSSYCIRTDDPVLLWFASKLTAEGSLDYHWQLCLICWYYSNVMR